MKKLVSILCMIVVLTLMTTPAYAAKKDTTAPTVTKTDPIGEATDVMIEQTIIIRFSEKIMKGKTFSKITVAEPGGTNVGYTCEIKDALLRITPDKNLTYNTVYTVVIPASAVKDKAGNNFKTRYSLVFRTEKDPKAKDDTQAQDDGLTKYIITMEANLDHELTAAELAQYAEFLKAFGFDAQFTDFKEAKE